MDEVKNIVRSLAEAVYRYSILRPDTSAIVDKKGPHTYMQFWKEIAICAQILRESGVRKCDRVVMECTQDAMFLAVNLSCQLLEAVFTGVERKVAPGRLQEIISQTTPALVITRKATCPNSEITSGTRTSKENEPPLCISFSEKQFDSLLESKLKDAGPSESRLQDTESSESRLQDIRSSESRLQEIGPSESKREDIDLATSKNSAIQKAEKAVQNLQEDMLSEILFSTGTTGKSKGAMLTNKANVANAQNIIDGVRMEQDAVELIPLPINHAHGLRTSYAHLLNGSTAVIANGITFPRVLFDLIKKYQVNALDFSPSAAQMLIDSSERKMKEIAPFVRYVEVGASFLPEGTKRALRECFPTSRLYNCYGSSESGRTCTLDFSDGADRPNCIGKSVPNATFKVLDENGNAIKSDPEHTGLLATAGPMNMSGYWKEPELSKKTLRNGYVVTADLSYIDTCGYIYVYGRKDDVIVYKGIKIAPDEIEEIVQSCSFVTDCALVPVEDRTSGQIPHLFVVPENPESFKSEELIVFMKANIDENRMPREIECIDKIPRTYNGKIQRKALMQRKNEETMS